MLQSKFVGVTAGLGTPSTDTCTGNKSTAPDAQAGMVMTVITNAKKHPSAICAR